MEQFTQPVKRKKYGQETAAIHGGLQGPNWAVRVRSLTAFFDFSNPK